MQVHFVGWAGWRAPAAEQRPYHPARSWAGEKSHSPPTSLSSLSLSLPCPPSVPGACAGLMEHKCSASEQRGRGCPSRHSGHRSPLPRHQETRTHIFSVPGPDVDLSPGVPVAAKPFFLNGALSWETRNFLIKAKRREQGSTRSPLPTPLPHM